MSIEHITQGPLDSALLHPLQINLDEAVARLDEKDKRIAQLEAQVKRLETPCEPKSEPSQWARDCGNVIVNLVSAFRSQTGGYPSAQHFATEVQAAIDAACAAKDAELEKLMLRSVGAMAIAEGDDNWQALPIDCPMLQAVKDLRISADTKDSTMGVLKREVDVLISQRTQRDAEIARLKRGEFTPEEFQDLCHHRDDLPGCTAQLFFDGCAAYQQNLFGLCERTQLSNEIARLKAGGCARDRSTTQFCAEAVALQAEVARLKEQLDHVDRICSYRNRECDWQKTYDDLRANEMPPEPPASLVYSMLGVLCMTTLDYVRQDANLANMHEHIAELEADRVAQSQEKDLRLAELTDAYQRAMAIGLQQKERLIEARKLIEYFGTVDAEDGDVIRAAQQWLEKMV